MVRLMLDLLGPPQIELDEEPGSGFVSDKVRALLFYLAVEVDHAHRRESLAGLLWPDYPERSARTNLSNALSNLRTVLGDRDANVPFFHISREAIQFNAQSSGWVDASAFQAHTERQQWEEAIALYRGPFLEGFSLSDSPPFEQWALVLRERLQREMLSALQELGATCEAREDYARAGALARRQLEIEPWHEGAYRALMRALALGGERASALAEYENCARILRQELDVAPGAETRRLYEEIRAGRFGPEGRGPEGPPGISVAPIAPDLDLSAASQVQPPASIPVTRIGEHRLATVLSVQVSESATILDERGPEAWAGMMSDVLDLVESGVRRYGGEIEERATDHLVALFGVPTAHEDDPERAILAALALQEEMDSHFGERGDLGLHLHAGVDTGEVLVTHDRGGWQVVGRVTMLARRASIAARPDEVLVGENTRRLVSALFEWESSREGASELFRPLARMDSSSKGRGIEGLSSPLVGRDAEFGTLQEAVERLCLGIGGLVTLVGDAGIGKSRLVAEVRQNYASAQREIAAPQRAAEQPTDVLPRWVQGRCLSYGANVAYGLWMGILRDLLGVSENAAPATVRDALLERVRALCPDRVDEIYPFLGWMMSLPLEGEIEVRLRDISGERLGDLIVHAVERLLESTATNAPLVVVCEDLHWAAPTSLSVLESLLPLVERVPLLFVCVFRPQSEHGCWRIREVATRSYRHCHTDLWLQPLTPADGESLVGNLLRVHTLPDALRELIVERAGGNPFFVEEIIRSLIDLGAISCEADGECWRATRDTGEIILPNTLHGVLAARIDRLSPEARRVLQLASVVGYVFRYRVLVEIAPTKQSLDANLLTLQRAQVIREHARVPEREYAFEHALTREAAYYSLLAKERRAYHLRTAQVLESLFSGDVESQLGLLAHHWEQAGESQRAALYWRRAAEQAAAKYAYDEAVEAFGRALSLVSDTERAERYVLLQGRERVYHLQGARLEQERDLTAMQRLADEMADLGKQAEAAQLRAEYADAVGDPAACVAAAQRAIQFARAAGEPRIEALAHLHMGHGLGSQRDHDPESLLEHRRQALALARAHGLPEVEAESLRQLGLQMAILGHLARAREPLEQALRVFRSLGGRQGEGRTLFSLAILELEMGHLGGVQRLAEEGLRIQREVGSRREEGLTLWILGLAANGRRQYGQALSYYSLLLQCVREIGDRRGEASAMAGTGAVLADLGDGVRAVDHLERALSIARLIDYWEGELEALVRLGLLVGQRGDHEAARTYGEQALQIGERQFESVHDRQALDGQAQALYVVGRAWAGLGRWDEAIHTYQHALRVYDTRGTPVGSMGPRAGLADVYMRQGDPAQALLHVQKIMRSLETRAIDGELEPFLVYLVCYRVLQANQDPRARGLLSDAYAMLHESVVGIEDETLQQSFLERVTANREIVAEFVRRPQPADIA
jgi:predicted ATPase/DNA-binding SARP family transcriptional activator/class 3 adenylate cyclase